MNRSILRWTARILVIDAAIAIAVPLFQSIFDRSATLPLLIRQYVLSVLYANLVGIPIALSLPPVWVRTACRPVAVKAAARAGVVLAANFVGCLLAGLVTRALIGPAYHYWPEFRGSFGLSLVLSAIATAFISMYETQQARLRNTAMRLKTNELERERALKLASEARLSSLESRIHPHFLFNTINSVSSLIHEDPVQAEKILLQLAELLRFSLDLPPGGLVPLERELRIVEDYLEIEAARFGSRLQFDLQIAAAPLDAAVPPLSLQTLVENSVKYAVNASGRGAHIRVSAWARSSLLHLEVEDDGPGFARLDFPAGHGLHNLQERLSALFGEAARLGIESQPGRTLVTVDLPRRSALHRADEPTGRDVPAVNKQAVSQA